MTIQLIQKVKYLGLSYQLHTNLGISYAATILEIPQITLMPNFPKNRKLLTQIQRYGCLNLTGVTRTTPSRAFEVLLNKLR